MKLYLRVQYTHIIICGVYRQTNRQTDSPTPTLRQSHSTMQLPSHHELPNDRKNAFSSEHLIACAFDSPPYYYTPPPSYCAANVNVNSNVNVSTGTSHTI